MGVILLCVFVVSVSVGRKVRCTLAVTLEGVRMVHTAFMGFGGVEQEGGEEM